MKIEHLTIFTCPKAFNSAYNTVQNNAIQSWKLLRPTPRIILFTDNRGEKSVKQAAKTLDVEFGGVVQCNNHGTPLVNSLWNCAEQIASTQLLAYVNADIVLMQDWGQVVSFLGTTSSALVEFNKFLAIGRRRDWQKITQEGPVSPDEICFDDTWEKRVKADYEKVGNWHPPGGLDYFVFTRGLYRNIPSFAIGRYAWDNWFAAEALRIKVPVIDITEVTFVIHQRHRYGQQGELIGAELVDTTEAKANRELYHSLNVPNVMLQHATYYIKNVGTHYEIIKRQQEKRRSQKGDV